MLGDEAHPPVAPGGQRRLGQRLHPDEPLIGEPGLHHGIAAVAVADGVAVALDSLHRSELLQRGHYFLPGFVAVEPPELFGYLVVHPGVVGHDVERLEPVPAGDLEVHRIVGRGQLHGAGAEGGVHRLVEHDRDPAADQRAEWRNARRIPGTACHRGGPRPRCPPASFPGGWWPPPAGRRPPADSAGARGCLRPRLSPLPRWRARSGSGGTS